MIAHELRLGNYINALDDYDQAIASQVIALSDGAAYIDEYGNRVLFYTLNGEYAPEQCSIEGIKITEEWIKRLGFEEDSIIEKRFNKDDYQVYFFKDDDYIYLRQVGSTIAKIKYIHQLQNLYFALTGEELTLNQ